MFHAAIFHRIRNFYKIPNHVCRILSGILCKWKNVFCDFQISLTKPAGISILNLTAAVKRCTFEQTP